MRRVALMALLACWLPGCASRRASVRAAPVAPALAVVPDRLSFIDLEAGWRISVITPLLKSGGFVLPPGSEPAQVSGRDRALTVEITAGQDFLGYERSYYAVNPRDRGVRVRFTSAETVREGKMAAQPRPVVPLFQLPASLRYVRLVYLLRSSQVNHNMAVVAAREHAALDPLTAAIQRDPAGACQSQRGPRDTVCQWMPAGIAVRPEKRNAAGTDWVPAR